jgi:hypothetical protein
MHMAKSKGGRPAWQPTAKERGTVKAMTSYGISQDAICAVLKVTRATLEKHCRHELASGAAEATVKVAASMFAMALRGPYAVRFQAAKFWLAARAGWRDTDRAEPLVAMMPLSNLSDEAWRQLCAVNKFDPDGQSKVVQFPATARRR